MILKPDFLCIATITAKIYLIWCKWKRLAEWNIMENSLEERRINVELFM